MSGSSFGSIFKVSTFGESHGKDLGVVIDGCPPGISLTEDDIQPELDRRKPGQSSITTPRKESDVIHIRSGVYEGKTTGTPILLIAHNKDSKSEDYDHLVDNLRPSHADYTYIQKYGLRDHRGSGRASARETLARVAAGAIAKKYLRERLNVEFLAYVEQVGDIVTAVDMDTVTLADVESNIVRCPCSRTAKLMEARITEVLKAKDSIGGIVRGLIRNLPGGLGEPVFDKLHAELGKAMLSINAVKGFDIGAGFNCVNMLGSEHNDPYYLKDGEIRTKRNHSGGVIGGISSGETIYFRTAFKPVSTIGVPQQTVDLTNRKETTLAAHGRHDPCVLPRAVPIVEAMSALVIMDMYLRQRARLG